MSQTILPMVGQGTTSSLALFVEADLMQATDIVASVKQPGRALNFDKQRILTFESEDEDVPGTLLLIHLTQKETLSLKPIDAEVQVRWLNPDHEAYKTEIENINIKRALFKGVLGEVSA